MLHSPCSQRTQQNILEMYVLRPPTLKPVQTGREAPGHSCLTPGPHPRLPPTRLTDGGRERLSQKQGQTCDKSCHAHSLNTPRGGGASTLQGRSKLTRWWGDTEAQGSQVTPPEVPSPGVVAEQRAGALALRRLGPTEAGGAESLSSYPPNPSDASRNAHQGGLSAFIGP